VTDRGLQGKTRGYLGRATPLSDAGVMLECWAPPDLCLTRKSGNTRGFASPVWHCRTFYLFSGFPLPLGVCMCVCACVKRDHDLIKWRNTNLFTKLLTMGSS